MIDELPESEFDALPEAFRLALMERARILGDAALDDDLPATTPKRHQALTMRAIEQAAAIGRGTVHNRYAAALLKLRRRAEQLDLSPES